MKYRKKPVVVEAVQWTGDNIEEMENFLKCDLINAPIYDGAGYLVEYNRELDLFIRTLEGDHLARKNDYIIRGVKGEFYSCKPDIFKMTYEEVE